MSELFQKDIGRWLSLVTWTKSVPLTPLPKALSNVQGENSAEGGWAPRGRRDEEAAALISRYILPNLPSCTFLFVPGQSIVCHSKRNRCIPPLLCL